MKCAAFAGVVAVMTLAVACSPTQREEITTERDAAFVDRRWDDGVYQAEKGFEQLAASDRNLAEADPGSALRQLKKSAEHLDAARAHFAKAEVGREKRGAVEDVNARYGALDRAFAFLAQGATSGEPDPDFMNPEVVQTVWKSHLDIANKHYEPGVFTTLIAFEWRSPPSNQNLHRNVIFRDDEGPDVPFSAFNDEGTVETKPSDPPVLRNGK